MMGKNDFTKVLFVVFIIALLGCIVGADNREWGQSHNAKERKRQHSEEEDDDEPHEDLGEEPEPDDKPGADPHEDKDENEEEYFKEAIPEHEAVEPAPPITVVEAPISKGIWHPVKKFFKNRIPALCKLYMHHEKSVESLLMSFLNMGSKPVHSSIISYCKKNVAEDDARKAAEGKKPKSTMGRLFGWLSKKIGISEEKKEEHIKEPEKPKLTTDRDESVMIQPKVVNLIISPEAAISVQQALRSELGTEDLANESFEENNPEEQSLKDEIWKGVEENFEESYKNDVKNDAYDNSGKPHPSSIEVVKGGKRKRNTCKGEACEFEEIRKSLETIASPEGETSQDLDELAKEIVGLQKIKKKPSRRKVEDQNVKRNTFIDGNNLNDLTAPEQYPRLKKQKRKSNTDMNKDKNDDDKYYDFFDKFTMPPLEIDSLEDEVDKVPALGKIVSAEQEVELKPNHHHHIHDHSAFNAWEYLKGHQTEMIYCVVSTAVLILLFLLLYFCWKRRTRFTGKLRRSRGRSKLKKEEAKSDIERGSGEDSGNVDSEDSVLMDVTVTENTDSDNAPELIKKGTKKLRSRSLHDDRKRQETARSQAGKSPWLSSEGSWDPEDEERL